eukprot:TRINITY_DN5045_c0_g1_i4.p1 TRINITY_DN5045_c0_g1~~TRINITY_DN5045_c0_g1_i4.p1  ORF type:complete len:815 (-),score=228.56 TRINITY_DN5045_c0_g1_i4:45-2489(-)
MAVAIGDLPQEELFTNKSNDKPKPAIRTYQGKKKLQSPPPTHTGELGDASHATDDTDVMSKYRGFFDDLEVGDEKKSETNSISRYPSNSSLSAATPTTSISPSTLQFKTKTSNNATSRTSDDDTDDPVAALGDPDDEDEDEVRTKNTKHTDKGNSDNDSGSGGDGDDDVLNFTTSKLPPPAPTPEEAVVERKLPKWGESKSKASKKAAKSRPAAHEDEGDGFVVADNDIGDVVAHEEEEGAKMPRPTKKQMEEDRKERQRLKRETKVIIPERATPKRSILDFLGKVRPVAESTRSARPPPARQANVPTHAPTPTVVDADDDDDELIIEGGSVPLTIHTPPPTRPANPPAPVQMHEPLDGTLADQVMEECANDGPVTVEVAGSLHLSYEPTLEPVDANQQGAATRTAADTDTTAHPMHRTDSLSSDSDSRGSSSGSGTLVDDEAEEEEGGSGDEGEDDADADNEAGDESEEEEEEGQEDDYHSFLRHQDEEDEARLVNEVMDLVSGGKRRHRDGKDKAAKEEEEEELASRKRRRQALIHATNSQSQELSQDAEVSDQEFDVDQLTKTARDSEGDSNSSDEEVRHRQRAEKLSFRLSQSQSLSQSQDTQEFSSSSFVFDSASQELFSKIRREEAGVRRVRDSTASLGGSGPTFLNEDAQMPFSSQSTGLSRSASGIGGHALNSSNSNSMGFGIGLGGARSFRQHVNSDKLNSLAASLRPPSQSSTSGRSVIFRTDSTDSTAIHSALFSKENSNHSSQPKKDKEKGGDTKSDPKTKRKPRAKSEGKGKGTGKKTAKAAAKKPEAQGPVNKDGEEPQT